MIPMLPLYPFPLVTFTLTHSKIFLFALVLSEAQSSLMSFEPSTFSV